ncbi:MAG: KH domain-containing protein [Lentisphaeria bacterium]|nr:KH domain-containing protein [Lentisphaeria bacterium]
MSENAKLDEQKTKATKTLMTMLDYLGLDATLRVEEKGNKLAIKITSDDAGRIIGRKGQTLDSLQVLLNRILFRGEENCPHIMLDIDGYAHGNNRSSERRENDGASEDRPRRQSRRRRDENGEGRSAGIPPEQLRIQALDTAKEVKKWGEPVTLPPMNAHDRRIIHVTLQDDPEIETQSEGEGAVKKVIVSLKKTEA